MKYRIVEENEEFNIEIEIIPKSVWYGVWYGKKSIEWKSVDKDGKPFHFMRVGIFNKVDNWDSRLNPFNSLEEATEKKEMFEKGITIHN